MISLLKQGEAQLQMVESKVNEDVADKGDVDLESESHHVHIPIELVNQKQRNRKKQGTMKSRKKY